MTDAFLVYQKLRAWRISHHILQTKLGDFFYQEQKTWIISHHILLTKLQSSATFREADACVYEEVYWCTYKQFLTDCWLDSLAKRYLWLGDLIYQEQKAWIISHHILLTKLQSSAAFREANACVYEEVYWCTYKQYSTDCWLGFLAKSYKW